MADKQMVNRRVQPLLEKLGLSKNEAKCYLASLAIGSAKMSDVAHEARINRVNVYHAVKALLARGLVEQESTRGGTHIHTAPVSHLLQLARDVQQDTSKLRWKIEDIIPQLEGLKSKHADAPSVVMGDIMFFRGADVFNRILDRSLDAPEGSTNCYLQAFDYFRSPEDPTYDREYYIPRRLKRSIKARVLYRYDEYARTLRANDAKELRETRFLPAGVNTTCYLLIYGNEAALLWKEARADGEEETYGIVIRSGPLYDLMKVLFEVVWQIAGESEKKKG